MEYENNNNYSVSLNQDCNNKNEDSIIKNLDIKNKVLKMPYFY